MQLNINPLLFVELTSDVWVNRWEAILCPLWRWLLTITEDVECRLIDYERRKQ
jgi:hypothetical protein